MWSSDAIHVAYACELTFSITLASSNDAAEVSEAGSVNPSKVVQLLVIVARQDNVSLWSLFSFLVNERNLQEA